MITELAVKYGYLGNHTYSLNDINGKRKPWQQENSIDFISITDPSTITVTYL